jgi:hypothetical protein
MASDIDIASNALQLIGDLPISSFDDPGAGAAVAKALYADTLLAMLTRTYWTFTLKKQTLNRLSSTPLNEFQYEFQLPTDTIKVLKVYPRSNYKIYGDRIYSNTQALDIDYAFKPETSQLPPHFVLAFTYKLASDFALAVTDSENKNAIFEEKFRLAMAEAYAADAQGNPQTPIVDQPFTDARHGGYSGHGGGF